MKTNRKYPNLIFVFADQMRAHATGYAGDPNVKTPYLDRLAGESLNLVNATSNCPICTPYRACLLTGQYPLTHGLFMNDLCLPDNGNSFAQVLGRAGYDTAYIGKWHLDGHGRTAPIPSERRQGFDYWKVLECTHDYNRSQYYAGNDMTPHVWKGYDAYAQTDDAIDYLAKRRDGTRPFALFLSFGIPHDPYDTAPEDLKALYPPDSLILRENVAEHRQAAARRQLTGYYAHVSAIDRCMERLDAALERTGRRDDTILVFTSDHGDLLESHWHLNTTRGSRKQMPYDESVMVPFLLRYPARFGDSGRAIQTPLAAPDIMPTLLGLAGIEIPATVEGLDLGETLQNGRQPERDGVLIANYHPFADWSTARGGRPYRGIRTERYTYVRDLNGPWLLFDNQADPFQLDNLVNKSVGKSVQQELESQLQNILEAQNDPFAPPENLRQHWGYVIDDAECIPY